jgi:hypothetical protein
MHFVEEPLCTSFPDRRPSVAHKKLATALDEALGD